MSLTIELPKELEASLASRARAVHMPTERYVASIIEHALELLLLKDQQVVEAFLPHTPHEAFADRIGAWRMRGRFENLDATCPRHPSKARPEFAIVITNQVLRCLAKGGGFSQVLGHPGISRRSCHADMDHSSCLERGC